jgi:glucosamine--fructose-6-phosphate aminotransferase (isomerizing)
MCQLAAYIGESKAAPLLLESLRLQEGYFGGHATGLATIHNRKLEVAKDVGPVDFVTETSDIINLDGNMGIAHSRLGVSAVDDARYNRAKNAHPFMNKDRTIALMHNGEINNYDSFWKKLKTKYSFSSYSKDIDYITESEVAVHLLDSKMEEGFNFPEALKKVANELTGMVLLAAVSINDPDSIYITNWIQACVLATGVDENMFSSSPLGLEHVKDRFNVFYAPYNSFIKLSKDKIEVSKLDPYRSVPNLVLDRELFRDSVLKLLKDREQMTSLELILALQKSKDNKIYGLDAREWDYLVKEGWGDQNQLIDLMLELSKERVVNRLINERVEGGQTIPRVVWSLA